MIHLVPNASAAGWLKQLRLGQPIRIRDDLLTFGPCDVDPAKHRALRAVHLARWGLTGAELPTGFVTGEDLGTVLGDDEVVLWTSATWDDRVFTWNTLDAFERLGVARERVWVAQPGGDTPETGCGGFATDETRAALEAARPLSEAEYAEGAQLWRLFASPSPLEFDQARRRGSTTFPDLTRVGEAHAAWFPWNDGNRVRLSDVDAALLGALGQEPQPVYELRLAVNVNGLAILDRLWAWHGVGAVEMDRDPATLPPPRTAERIAITATGQRLLEHGAPQVGAFPPVWIGGCRVNDPAAAYVRDLDGAIRRRPAGPS